MRYARIIAEFAGQPMALEIEKYRAVAAFLQAKALGAEPPAYEPRGEKRDGEPFRAAITNQKAAKVAGQPGSIAVIPVVGVLTQRAMGGEMSEVGTKTERVARYFRAALADDTVKAIIFDIDSPGGSVFGVEELGAEIFAARGGKPIVAQVNSLAASAAYWLAAQADDIAVTPGGLAGSIGVYQLHEDWSQFYEAAGVKSEFIHAGRYKVEGHDRAPLEEEARAAIQSRVDAYYTMFVDAVARGRGTDTKSVRDGYGEGRVVMAKDAVRLGMADRVATMADTLARFGVETRAQNTPPKPRGRAMARAREIEMLGLG